jgi:acyl-CoA thioesterase I
MSKTRWILGRNLILFLGLIQISTAIGLAVGAGPAQASEVVALGASNTYGYGLQRGEDYPSQLEALLRQMGFPVSVKNAGISGNTSQQILDRLDGVLDADTKIVVLEVFTYNDGRRGVPAADTKAHIAEMLAKLKARHIKAILIGDADVRSLPRQSDGIHFTAEGQGTVARRVLPGVIASLRR